MGKDTAGFLAVKHMMGMELQRESPGRTTAPRLTAALIGLALFALALGRFLFAVNHTPFNRDEARWVYHAAAVRDLLHPLGPAWTDSIVTRDQPPLAGYVLGAGMLAQGRRLGSVGWWDMSQGRSWNASHHNMPARADLLAARRTNAVLSAVAVAALFLLVARLTNLAGGIAAGLFLTAHPLTTRLASTADSDMLLALLLVLAALAGIWLAGRPGWPRALTLGALLGLGGAAKLSPLAVAVALAALGLLIFVRERSNRSMKDGERPSRLAVMLLVQPIIAAAVFVAVSPYLWRDPVGHARNLFTFRTEEMTNQRRIWPELAINSSLDTLHWIWKLLGTQLSASGWLVDQAQRVIGGSWGLPGVDLALGLAGLAILALLVARRGLTSPTAVAVAIIGGEALLAVVGMRVYFARYLMPLTLALAAGFGVLIGALWSALARRNAEQSWLAHSSDAAAPKRFASGLSSSRRKPHANVQRMASDGSEQPATPSG